MKKMMKNKSFYATALAITIPIALQNLISFGISVTDTIMIGRLGEIQLSACAQANQPNFVFMLLTFGLASGGCVLTSQYWGKKNLVAVKKVIAIVLRISIVISLALSAFVLLFPHQIMSFYLKDELAISEGVKYLKIVGFAYFFFGITSTMTGIIRSVEIVKITVLVNLISFFINLAINYVLIFGNFGAPKMGIRGAAIGTLCARIIEFIIISIYILVIDKKICFRIKDIFSHDIVLFKDYIRYSFPVVLNEIAWGGGISLQAAILGNLSKQIVAAASIANVLQQFATIIIFGVANAACVLVGKKIGEGDIDGARETGNTLMKWSIILGLIGSAVLFLLRNQFISIYNLTDSGRILAEKLVVFTAIMITFISISAISIVGVLRGAGDTKFSLKLELVTLWLFAIPIGAISGYIFKVPVLLTYMILKMDEPIKSCIAFIRTTKASTYKSVTRDE